METGRQTDDHRRPLAVVTGASSGIGYALAEELANRGLDLLIAAESERLESAAQTGSALVATAADTRAEASLAP